MDVEGVSSRIFEDLHPFGSNDIGNLLRSGKLLRVWAGSRPGRFGTEQV